MSEPKMKTRRRAAPGFAKPPAPGEQVPRSTVQPVQEPAPEPTPAPPVTAPAPAAAATEPAEMATTAPRAVARRAGGTYNGAGARQVNVRMPLPLIERYEQLVAELKSEGASKVTLTELLCAQLDQGPTTTAQARARLRTWREKTSEI